MKKLSLFAALCMIIVACEKTEEATQNNQESNTPSTPVITIPGTDAALIAIKTSSTTEVPIIGTTTVVTGTAAASFFDGNGGTTLQNAGKVECVGEELKNQDNAYFYQITPNNTSGLSFGATVGWKVAGNGAVPAINEVYNREVPEIGKVTGANGDVSRSNDVTLSFDPNNMHTDVSSADSILFNIIDKDGKMLSQTKANTATSATFTAAEMGTLAEGFAFVQIAAYNYQVKDINGYMVAFINQGSNTKSVTLK